MGSKGFALYGTFAVVVLLFMLTMRRIHCSRLQFALEPLGKPALEGQKCFEYDPEARQNVPMDVNFTFKTGACIYFLGADKAVISAAADGLFRDKDECLPPQNVSYWYKSGADLIQEEFPGLGLSGQIQNFLNGLMCFCKEDLCNDPKSKLKNRTKKFQLRQ